MRLKINKDLLISAAASLVISTALLTSSPVEARPRQATIDTNMPYIQADGTLRDHFANNDGVTVSKRRGKKNSRVAVSRTYGGGSIVSVARSQIGNGPVYGRSNLWCARFMNWVLAKSGYQGTGSDMAKSFISHGRRLAGPQVGAIAIMNRGRGGHVGVVSGIDSNGNPIIISGNHNNRVAESVYPRGRIIAYVAL